MKKKLAALLAVSLCLSIPAFANEGPDYPGDVSDTSLPFTAAVKQNGKWGAVNDRGAVVIPVSYDAVGISLSGPDVKEMDLSSEPGRGNLIEVESKKERGFYDRSGQVIIPVSYVSRSIWKEGALAVERKDKQISFYKKDGTLLSKDTYDQVSDFQNGMAIVKKGGKYGYLSISGRDLPPIYQEARYFENGLAPVREKGKWGVIDTVGQEVVPPTYKDTGPHYSEGLLAVKDNQNMWGFIDTTGKVLVPAVYKDVVPVFTEGYTAFESDNKQWGFMDKDGHITATPRFLSVLTPFSEGLIGVKTTDGNGYAKPDGTIAFMADYDRLFPFDGGIAEVRQGETKVMPAASRGWPVSIGIGWGWGHWFHGHHHYHPGWGLGIGFPIWDPWYYDYDTIPTIQVHRGYIDNTGKVIASPANDRVFEAGDKGILVFKDGLYGWTNKKGDYIAHVVYTGLIPDEDDNVLLEKSSNKLWGLLSMDDGHDILPATYKEMKILGSGYFGFKEDGKWGILDKTGAIIAPASYRAVSYAAEGLIPVKDKDGWKFIASDGTDAITFKQEADDVTSFHKGLAGVKIKGKWGLIDKNGRFVLQPTYEDMDIL